MSEEEMTLPDILEARHRARSGRRSAACIAPLSLCVGMLGSALTIPYLVSLEKPDPRSDGAQAQFYKAAAMRQLAPALEAQIRQDYAARLQGNESRENSHMGASVAPREISLAYNPLKVDEDVIAATAGAEAANKLSPWFLGGGIVLIIGALGMMEGSRRWSNRCNERLVRLDSLQDELEGVAAPAQAM